MILRTLSFFALLLAPYCLAQTDLTTFEASLKGKQLWLRNYSADQTTQYDWKDGTLVSGPVLLHHIGAFLPQSVKLKHGSLILEGQRATLLRNSKEHHDILTAPASMTIEIHLQGADLATVLPALHSMLAFSNEQQAISEAPGYIRESLPYDLSPLSSPDHPTGSLRIHPDESFDRTTANDPDLVQPKLISSVDPKFTRKARKAWVDDGVILKIRVSDLRQVSDLWLAFPLGYDLDESAARAVRQYVFEPARYKGEPISTTINIVIHFQVQPVHLLARLKPRGAHTHVLMPHSSAA